MHETTYPGLPALPCPRPTFPNLIGLIEIVRGGRYTPSRSLRASPT